jgi:hypothetical protein
MGFIKFTPSVGLHLRWVYTFGGFTPSVVDAALFNLIRNRN